MQQRIPKGWLAGLTLFSSILGGLLGFTSASLASLFFWTVAVAVAVAVSKALLWAFLRVVLWAMTTVLLWGKAWLDVWAWAWWAILALFVAGLAVGEAVILVLNKALVWALALAGSGSGAVTWAVGVAYLVAGCGAYVNLARVGLLESFNERQIFLILFGVAAIGLWLGWAIGFAVRSSGLLPIAML